MKPTQELNFLNNLELACVYVGKVSMVQKVKIEKQAPPLLRLL